MQRAFLWIFGILIVACGSSPNGDRRAFLVAAENGDTHIVREQLELGVRPDDVFELNDRTALFLAAINGHADVVDLLLEKGADASRTHLGASLKMEVTAHLGHLRDAHQKPDSESTYKRVDGTVVRMNTLRLDEASYAAVLKRIDLASR